MDNSNSSVDIVKDIFGDDKMVRLRVLNRLADGSILAESINDPDGVMMDCFINGYMLRDCDKGTAYDVEAFCDKGRVLLSEGENIMHKGFRTVKIV